MQAPADQSQNKLVGCTLCPGGDILVLLTGKEGFRDLALEGLPIILGFEALIAMYFHRLLNVGGDFTIALTAPIVRARTVGRISITTYDDELFQVYNFYPMDPLPER